MSKFTPGSADGTAVAVTTTHAAPGAGRPRLVFIVGDDWRGAAAREYELVGEVTRIGSGPDTDLTLGGLLPNHAEIRHDKNDEYVLFVEGPAGLDHTVDDADGVTLRTGSRVELLDWSMSFARDEVADRGRPYGGREGGEFAHQADQPDRTDPDLQKIHRPPPAQ